MDRPRTWSGILEADTAARVHNLIDTILRYRCTCVSIVQSPDNIEVQTSRSAEIKEGKAAHIAKDSKYIDWSIGGYFVSIRVDHTNPVRISWNGYQLVLRLNAPAGHPLVWVYAPEVDPETGEWIVSEELREIEK